MAATVQTRATGATTAADTTSHAITMPASIAAGDLLIIIFSVDNTPVCTASAGWNKGGQAANSTVVTGAWFWKYADGGDTCTITTDSAQQSSHVSLRISGASTPTGTSANGSSTNSNPPSHNSGETSTLWLATRSGDSTVVATVAPTNYGNLQTQAAAGTSGASSNTAERTTSATSEDPGTFTSNTEQWVSWTISVPDQPTDRPFVTEYGAVENNGNSSITQAVHVAIAGSILVVGPSAYDATEADTRVTGITYNSVSLTQVAVNEDNNGGDGSSNYIYSIPNLAAGTHDLVITYAGVCDAPTAHWIVVANAHTTNVEDAHDIDNTSANATQTGNVTTIADKCLVWSWIGFSANGGGSASGSDQWQTGSTESGFVISSFSKTIKTPAGAVTHTYVNGTTDSSTMYLISIAPPAVVGGTAVKDIIGMGIVVFAR